MKYTKLSWRNDQPYSERFDDVYYSSGEGESISGEAEFRHVFFNNNNLPDRWSDCRSSRGSGTQNFVIAELGFGSGLNCLLTIQEWLKQKQTSDQRGCLHYIAIEKYPLSSESIRSLISQYPELKSLCTELLETYPPAVQGAHSRYLFDNRVVIHYKFMDALEALKDERYQVDAWYLDGFSPAKNAAMWSSQLFEKIAQNSHQRTTCSTYTAAGFVRRNLQAVGFEVKKVTGYGRKRDMLIANMPQQSVVPSTPQSKAQATAQLNSQANSQANSQTNTQQQKQYKYNDSPWFAPVVSPAYSRQRATIIGAGIAGLCVACSLVKRGWTVTVIDKYGKPARETSSNPAAIVYPRLSINDDVDSQFNVQAYSYALYCLNMLQKKHSKKFWFSTGLLQAMEAEKITAIMKNHEFNEDFAVLAEHSKQSCIEYRAAGVVLPQALCEVLSLECGDKLNIVKASVENVKRNDKHWQCYAADGLINESEILVIASGVQLDNLIPEVNFPVEPVRGQALVLSEQKQSEAIEKAVNAGVYLTPLIANNHFLGATYSRDNNSTEVDEHDSENLLSAVNRIYPGGFTRDDIEQSWVGFRATSKDRVPVVGAVADQCFFKKEYADLQHGKQSRYYQPAKHLDGLYISAAHGSRGFTTSFLCAELIVSQIEGSPSPLSKAIVDYLNPSRFIVHDLKRGL